MSASLRISSDPPWEIRWIFFDAVGTLIRVRSSVGEIYGRQAADFGFQPASSTSSYPLIEAAFRESFREATLHHPQKMTDESNEREWWRQVVEGTFERIAPFPQLDRCFDRIYELFRTAETWKLEPGAMTSMTHLARTKKLGIISNFDSRLTDVLTALGIRALLQQLTIPRLAGEAKPEPEIFRYAMNEVGADPSECLYVGDEYEDDYSGPRAVGMQALLYDPRNRQTEKLDLHRIRTLGEIPRFLV